MQRVLPVVPPEVVALDTEEPCPYLPGETARRPLRVPLRRLSGKELDARLHAGDRRSGIFLYNQECPRCEACEALRLDVREFVPSATHRRTLRRGAELLDVEVGPPMVDAERVTLFRAHQEGRDLARGGPPIDEIRYREFLVDSFADGIELRARLRATGALVAVATTDRGETALSAVYTTWSPALASLSLGTFMILRQLELAQAWGKRWLYLGLAIEKSPAMRYKLGFVPHQRRVKGVWQRFGRAEGGALTLLGPGDTTP
jgi:leucyl-tRNA---protein transferase